jgi:hypothetical protein
MAFPMTTGLISGKRLLYPYHDGWIVTQIPLFDNSTFRYAQRWCTSVAKPSFAECPLLEYNAKV